MAVKLSWDEAGAKGVGNALGMAMNLNQDEFELISGNSERSFLIEISKFAIDLMGKGDTKELLVLWELLSKAVGTNRETNTQAAMLHRKLRFALKLQSLSELINIYLSIPNDAKSVGKLIGKQSQNRKKLLITLYKKDRRYLREELEKLVTDIRPSTLYKVINELIQVGLMHRIPLNEKTHLFELTWEGRRIAQKISETNTNDQPQEKAKEVAKIEMVERIEEKKNVTIYHNAAQSPFLNVGMKALSMLQKHREELQPA